MAPSTTNPKFEPALWLIALACLSWFCFAGALFLITGCAARKNAGSPQTVPGCDAAHVVPQKGCYLVKYPDHLEQICEKKVFVNGKVRVQMTPTEFTCKTNPTTKEKQ